MTRVRTALALLCLAAMSVGAPALAEPRAAGSPVAASPAPGSSVQYEDGVNTYRVYTPKGYRPALHLPLYVMVHGCNTNADEQERANLLDELADRERFVVLYVDHDQQQSTAPGTHPVRCWRFYSGSADQQRGAGDPGTIARQTEAVAQRWSVDRSRVYLTGMSSGGMMTSNVAAAYPDVYAAVAVVAGCAYAAGPTCFTGSAEDTDRQAQAAHSEQGPRARVIPTLAVQGDQDGTVSPKNNQLVIDQALKTANLALSGDLARPLSLRPATAVTRRPTGRYAYLDETYRDPQGRTVAQRVLVHGMDHFWPGGSSDPSVAVFTDPKGPSGAELTWRFLSQYRLVDGRTVYAAPAAPGPAGRPERATAAPRASEPATSGGSSSSSGQGAPRSVGSQLPATGLEGGASLVGVLVLLVAAAGRRQWAPAVPIRRGPAAGRGARRARPAGR